MLLHSPGYQQVESSTGTSGGQCGQLKHQYKAGGDRWKGCCLASGEGPDGPPLRVDRRTARPDHLRADVRSSRRGTATPARSIRPRSKPRPLQWTVFGAGESGRSIPRTDSLGRT